MEDCSYSTANYRRSRAARVSTAPCLQLQAGSRRHHRHPRERALSLDRPLEDFVSGGEIQRLQIRAAEDDVRRVARAGLAEDGDGAPRGIRNLNAELRGDIEKSFRVDSH